MQGRTHFSYFPRRAILGIGASLALLGGCDSPFKQKDYLLRPVTREELRTIETRELAEDSRTPPRTVEDATKDVLTNIVTPTTAPATLDISLADVRAASLQNNLDLRVEIVSPEISAAELDAEEAKFESVFFAGGRRVNTDAPTSLGTEGSRSTFDSYEAGIDVPLRTGGSARVSFPLTESETNNPFSTLNPAYTSDLRFSISQPLLRNAGVNVNTHSIRVARYQDIIANARTKLEAIRILANADKAYWALYAARRELAVRQQQYELAVTQLEQAKRRVNAGDVAPIEITRAESGLAASLENIIIAQTAIRRRQRDLKRIMNRPDLPQNGPTEIMIATDPTPVGLDLDGDALADFAVANRMEMVELELQLAIDASTVDFQRNARLPLVTLDYSYTINGLGGSYGDSVGQVGDKNFEDWSVGLNAEIPIGNEAAKALFRQAVLIRLQRLATRDQREASIRQEVYDALDQLEQNWQRILAARYEAMLAGRTYDAEVRQFNVGERTSTDVLDAATRLGDAQSREVIALAEYEISQVDIAFATGTLLGMERVRWDVDDGSVTPTP